MMDNAIKAFSAAEHNSRHGRHERGEQPKFTYCCDNACGERHYRGNKMQKFCHFFLLKTIFSKHPADAVQSFVGVKYN